MTAIVSVETAPDTDVADMVLSLNEPMLNYAESPWFRAMARPALPRTGFNSSSVWGVSATDGAVIYASRYWNKHAAPVGIDGAETIELALQRPGEITENWLMDGVGYKLRSGGKRDKWRLTRDGYNEEHSQDEVLDWAGVDSPAALVGYIADAIHHGRVYSAMHRTVAKYAAQTPKGFIISLFASMEAAVKQGQSTVDRSIQLALDAPTARNSAPRSLMVEGKIVQTNPPEWSLDRLQAFGVRLGLCSHANAVSALTPSQVAEARLFGNSALRHCEASMLILSQQATSEQSPAQPTS